MPRWSQLQDVDTLLPSSGLRIVQGQLVVVIHVAVHHRRQVVQHVFTSRHQVLLVQTAVVEAVEDETFVDESLPRLLRLSRNKPHHRRLQGTGLVVAAVEDQ